MPFRPQAPPKKLPIDLSVIDTAKGRWLVAVQSIAETHSGRNLLLGIVLEQNIDEQTFRSRELGIAIGTHEAHDPDQCSLLLDGIREWIETTDGDGFLDLAKPATYIRDL
jgi:hypothetical protein